MLRSPAPGLVVCRHYPPPREEPLLGLPVASAARAGAVSQGGVAAAGAELPWRGVPGWGLLFPTPEHTVGSWVAAGLWPCSQESLSARLPPSTRGCSEHGPGLSLGTASSTCAEATLAGEALTREEQPPPPSSRLWQW